MGLEFKSSRCTEIRLQGSEVPEIDPLFSSKLPLSLAIINWFINFMKVAISKHHDEFVESGVKGFQLFLVSGPLGKSLL